MRTSIIIPSLNRSKCLERCLDSIKGQSVKPYEVIVETEEGQLAKIRNQAAKKATGEILVFIDDDVWCTRTWLQSIVETFQTRNVSGVSGPSVITDTFKANRDLFRWKDVKYLYDSLFLEGRQDLPGHFTRSGAWTTGACNEDCSYEGPVEFLEACNQSYKMDIFKDSGGFDEQYKGIGDWSEPDLAFRIRQKGHKLWFNHKAKLYHEPSQSGAYKKRSKDASNRMANYLLFSKRWIRPCFRHTLYKLFMRTYYAMQAFR